MPELVKALQNLVDYVRRRKLPSTVELDLDTPAGVQRTLDTLVQSGVVSVYSEGLDSVFAIGADQHLTAAYYRNAIIHFFVNASIAELALLRAAEVDVAAAASEFWEEALRLRDLLKFEFFFADKDEYRLELREELAGHDPGWESALSGGPEAIHALLRRCKPFSAHRILRPFLEAYRVVGDALERADPGRSVDETKFLATCLALGTQYRLQRRIHRTESISKVLFATALRLARNRDLVDPGPDLGDRRRALATELRAVTRRIDAIDLLAASRLAGLIE